MFGSKIELNTVKDMFKKLYILLVLGAALACHAAPKQPAKVPGSNDIAPDETQSVVTRLVSEMLTNNNYKKVELNDSLSQVIYNRYLKSLDEEHNYLTAADVKEFS